MNWHNVQTHAITLFFFVSIVGFFVFVYMFPELSSIMAVVATGFIFMFILIQAYIYISQEISKSLQRWKRNRAEQKQKEEWKRDREEAKRIDNLRRGIES